MTKPDVEIVFRSLSDAGESLNQAVEIILQDNSTLSPLLSDMGENAKGGMCSNCMFTYNAVCIHVVCIYMAFERNCSKFVDHSYLHSCWY